MTDIGTSYAGKTQEGCVLSNWEDGGKTLAFGP